MNTHIYVELERNGEVIRQLLTGLTPAQYKWRPAEGKWNLLEVICPLYDEEREDFRARAELILDDPAREWVKIDPPAWVMERDYANQNFEQRIQDFVVERDRSVAWLRSLKEPKWDNFFMHPKVGPVSAQLILDNWLAHDLLHIRQMVRIKYAYLRNHVSSPLDYAGPW